MYAKKFDHLPRVTQICGQLDKSAALTQWAANCTSEFVLNQIQDLGTIDKNYLISLLNEARFNFRNVSKKALDIGSQVHGAIEYYLKNNKEPFIEDENVLAGFIAFLEWKDDNKLEIIGTEKELITTYYKGTCDLVCMLNDKKYLIDFKTSKKPYGNRPYKEWGYQLSAYRSAFEGIEGSGVLRLDKETGYPDWYDMSKTHDQDLKCFNNLLDFYFNSHPRKAKQCKWEG